MFKFKLFNKYSSLADFDVSNLFLIKIFLLISLRKFFTKQLYNIPHFYTIGDNLIKEKGIMPLKVLKLVAIVNNFYDYKTLLEIFELSNKIDYKKLINIIEKNKNYILNYIQQFNLYLTIFMVIIYILPLVLILGSMFYKINYLLVIIIIIPLILILIKKINNLRKKLKW
jgi:hypothetical protein